LQDKPRGEIDVELKWDFQPAFDELWSPADDAKGGGKRRLEPVPLDEDGNLLLPSLAG
jgi:hypothetical protein